MKAFLTMIFYYLNVTWVKALHFLRHQARRRRPGERAADRTVHPDVKPPEQRRLADPHRDDAAADRLADKGGVVQDAVHRLDVQRRRDDPRAPCRGGPARAACSARTRSNGASYSGCSRKVTAARTECCTRRAQGTCDDRAANGRADPAGGDLGDGEGPASRTTCSSETWCTCATASRSRCRARRRSGARISQQATETIMKAIAALLPEKYRGAYAEASAPAPAPALRARRRTRRKWPSERSNDGDLAGEGHGVLLGRAPRDRHHGARGRGVRRDHQRRADRAQPAGGRRSREQRRAARREAGGRLDGRWRSRRTASGRRCSTT